MDKYYVAELIFSTSISNYASGFSNVSDSFEGSGYRRDFLLCIEIVLDFREQLECMNFNKHFVLLKETESLTAEN